MTRCTSGRTRSWSSATTRTGAPSRPVSSHSSNTAEGCERGASRAWASWSEACCSEMLQERCSDGAAAAHSPLALLKKGSQASSRHAVRSTLACCALHTCCSSNKPVLWHQAIQVDQRGKGATM